jgi:hypothetical protein
MTVAGEEGYVQFAFDRPDFTPVKGLLFCEIPKSDPCFEY